MSVTDDAFIAFAKDQEAEAKRRAATTTAVTGQEFAPIKWTGLEKGTTKILRFLGAVPDSKADVYTARTARIAYIAGDDNKRFRVVFPDRDEAPDHIIWRIIDRVNAIEWVDRKKTFPVKEKHPFIFNIVAKNGLKSTDKRFAFEKGWVGRQVFLANVIDREMMDWHRENKHTMLLSRSITEGKEGQQFIEEGVPCYGFVSLLAGIFKYYGSWEKYDIGVERTGIKETPYRVINASKRIEEVPPETQGFVSDEPLTEEELSWERYNLSQIFRYTTHTKILNRLQGTIARIDSALGTTFLEELKYEAEKEQEKWEEEKLLQAKEEVTRKEEEAEEEEERVAGPLAGPLTPPEPEAPTVQTVAKRPRAATFDTSLLKGWDQLSTEEKATISSVDVEGGVLKAIHYDTKETIYLCPSCGIAAPDFFVTCPSCGERFA